MIYLDYAATTPMSPSALQAYSQAAERFFGNTSSLHDPGSEAKRALEGGRRLIASLLGLPENGLHFTGSGSEASFLALVALAHANRNRKGHVITTQVEHSSVRNTFSWLEDQGFEVTRLAVGPDGRLDPDTLRQALRKETVLVSIQHVNSEIGSIHPLREIGELLSEHTAYFHTDMVQGFGKIELAPAQCHLDSLTISAHKIHGPKGVGAAWIDPAISWAPFIRETVHERGFRPGTVDVPAVSSFAVAAREAFNGMPENLERVRALRERLIDRIEHQAEGAVSVQGDADSCSPYILGLQIYAMEGQFAMLECSQKDVAISTGSACQVNQQKPSATLLSMGRSEEEAKNFIRLSLDPATTRQQVDRAAEILTGIIRKHLQNVRA